MFRRELLIITTLMVLIFLAVAGVGWFAVRELHHTSRQLVLDTLPGLSDAGLAGERMHENRDRMREMLLPHTIAEQAQLIAAVRSHSSEALWQDYADSIFESADRQTYEAMMAARTNYVQDCDRFLDQVTAGQTNEATAYFNSELARRFQSYEAAVNQVFAYKVRQGADRGKTILNAARYAPLAIAGLCVLIFLLGLALGLRSALSGRQK